MQEQQFWRITPRKLAALMSAHWIAIGRKESESQKQNKKQESLNWIKSMARKA